MQFGMFIAQWAAARLPARAHCSSTLCDVQCDDTFVHCKLHICVMCHSERKRHKLRAKGISTLHYRFLKLLNGFISSKQWIEFKTFFVCAVSAYSMSRRNVRMQWLYCRLCFLRNAKCFQVITIS